MNPVEAVAKTDIDLDAPEAPAPLEHEQVRITKASAPLANGEIAFTTFDDVYGRATPFDPTADSQLVVINVGPGTILLRVPSEYVTVIPQPVES